MFEEFSGALSLSVFKLTLQLRIFSQVTKKLKENLLVFFFNFLLNCRSLSSNKTDNLSFLPKDGTFFLCVDSR